VVPGARGKPRGGVFSGAKNNTKAPTKLWGKPRTAGLAWNPPGTSGGEKTPWTQRRLGKALKREGKKARPQPLGPRKGGKEKRAREPRGECPGVKPRPKGGSGKPKGRRPANPEGGRLWPTKGGGEKPAPWVKLGKEWARWPGFWPPTGGTWGSCDVFGGA